MTAAQALAGLLTGRESGPSTAPSMPTTWRELSLEASDRASLLIEWLRELLWIQSSEGLLPADAEIRELTETTLRARAGLAAPPEPGAVQRELKGVTYHDLEVRASEGGWYARIVFDV